MTQVKLSTEQRKEIEGLVGELVEFIQGRYASGGEPVIADFSTSTADGQRRSMGVNRLLTLTGVPRFCSSELLWRLFNALDEQFPDDRKLPPESIRRKLLSGLGEALDRQEEDVRQRIEGVLVLVHKANECEQILSEDPESRHRDSLQRIIEQGDRIRSYLIDFLVKNPSLVTVGVQSLFADEDDPRLVAGLIKSCGKDLDFVAQSGIIASQARIRATHVNNSFRTLSSAGIAAIEAFDRGLMDLLSLLEFDSDWRGDEVSRNKTRVEQRIKVVMEEFNTVYKVDIMSARKHADAEVARYFPAAVTEMIEKKVLNDALAGDVIQGEGRLHASIRLLKDGLGMRRLELQKGWAFIEKKAEEALQVESGTLDDEVARLRSEHGLLKENYDSDVLYEDHFQLELDRVGAELEVAQESRSQQKQAHDEIRAHIKQLIEVQRGAMDKLLEQIEAVEAKVRAQTKEVFKTLIGADVNAQRQVDIIEFGDPELSMSLVIGCGKNLSPDAQVAVAKTVNRQLQRTLLRGTQENLVVYARRFIPTELLLEVFREGDLDKGIHS